MAKLDWEKAKKISLGFEQDRQDRLQKQILYHEYKKIENDDVETTKLTFDLTPYDQSVIDGIKKTKQDKRKRSSTKKQAVKRHLKRGCRTVKTKAGRTWVLDELGFEILKK